MNDVLSPVSGALEQVDRHLAELLCRQALVAEAPVEDAELLALTAALVSVERGRGHVCIRLADWAEREFPKEGTGNDAGLPVFPELSVWQACLESSSLVGDGTRVTPLVLSGEGLVYLYRYWAAERRVERRLCELATEELPLAAEIPGGLLDDPAQAGAARRALEKGLCLISGGPGTGKTTTVAKIMALLYQADPGLVVSLAAPTGKAAETLGMRVTEEAARLVKEKKLTPELRALFPDPDEAATLHRLIGFSPRGARSPRYKDKRSLVADVVIVDEASMVDLLLMDSLLDALRPESRLILLGDKDQLVSVEAGSVFGDLCGWAVAPDSPLAGSIAILTTNYRFGADSALGKLSEAIREQRADDALAILDDESQAEVRRHEPTDDESDIIDLVDAELDQYLMADSPEAALDSLGRFRILCDRRAGPYGAYRMNRLVEQRLMEKGRYTGQPWYKGRPVLVTVNDYNLRLFNGDIGVVWPDPDDGVMYAWFRRRTGDGPALQRFPRARLPAHETAWAMTVHKAQGSEFDRVVLVLSGADSRVLSRELVYTGVTRARSKVVAVAEAEVVSVGIERIAERVSGLGCEERAG